MRIIIKKTCYNYKHLIKMCRIFILPISFIKEIILTFTHKIKQINLVLIPIILY